MQLQCRKQFVTMWNPRTRRQRRIRRRLRVCSNQSITMVIISDRGQRQVTETNSRQQIQIESLDACCVCAQAQQIFAVEGKQTNCRLQSWLHWSRSLTIANNFKCSIHVDVMCNVYVKTFFFLNPNPHKQYISKKKHKNNGSNFPLLPFRRHSSSLFYVFSSSFRRDDEPEGNASTCTCYPFVNGCRETVSGNSWVTMSPPPHPPV